MQKNIFTTLILGVLHFTINAQDAQKSSGHLFTVGTVEIECCNTRGLGTQKKLHVVSNAGTGVFQDISVQIKNQNGTVIATYGPINDDYTSPCFNLAGGINYTVNIINSSNQIMINNILGNSSSSPASYSLLAPKCGKEKIISETAGPIIPRRQFFLNLNYTTFTPKILVPGLGNIVGGPSNGAALSLEMALPNKSGKPRKLIPSIVLEASYAKMNYSDGLSLMRKKYPPMAASETQMRRREELIDKESIRNVILSVSIRETKTIGKLNVSAAAGIAYINHSIPLLYIDDAIIKTNSGQPLLYANSTPYATKTTRAGVGGDFKLGLSYWLSNTIALSADAGYLLTPNYQAKIDLLNASDTNGDQLFSTGELTSGTKQTVAYTYNLNTVRFNAGIKIALQRKHEYRGHVTLLK
jgi:hypothetical protein